MPLRAGVDLGGTKIQSVVTDDQHAVLGQARHPTPKDDGPQGVADGIVAAIREALEGAGADPSLLEGIGIGSPGVCPYSGWPGVRLPHCRNCFSSSSGRS